MSNEQRPNDEQNTGDGPPRPSAWASMMARRCPRCRQGDIFRGLWAMYDDCPVCGLDYDRGDPGHFTGAMYISYPLAIPLILLLMLVEHWLAPDWSFARLVFLASILSMVTVPWLWQYSRAMWIYFDRYFDPSSEDDHTERAPVLPDSHPPREAPMDPAAGPTH